MLIIFDLDDTLIDTSNTLTFFQLERALIEMKKEGLKVENFSKDLKKLRDLNCASSSAKDALKKFLIKKDPDSKFFDIGISKIYYEFPKNFKVSPFPKVKYVLNILSKNHELAIVSSGRRQVQILKLENAGIEPSLFSRIEIAPTTDKKPFYASVLRESRFCAEHILMCGDKVEVDLIPAKELGFVTVHSLSGREKRPIGARWVDYTIHELPELLNIVEEL